jgi:MFS family permease
MSSAGVMLCTANLAFKAAPKGVATAYLATNALASGLAATLAPILAGFLSDFFATQELSLTLSWKATSEAAGVHFPVISLRSLDFVFIISFLCGLYAVHRLLAITETGEVEERVVMGELYAEMRKTVRNVSNVAGLRTLTIVPYVTLRDRLTGRKPPWAASEQVEGTDEPQEEP